MKRLAETFGKNQQWLMERVLRYTVQSGFIKYTSTPGEGLRQSVAGMTASLAEAIKRYENGIPEPGPDEEVLSDPMTSFAVTEAARHRERGVTLRMFLGLMKYYKQSYLDLLDWKFRRDAKFQSYRLFVEKSFDRFEIAFIDEWAAKSPAELIAELQGANRQLTGEKNSLAAVFENTHVLMAYLDRDFNFVRVNRAYGAAMNRKPSSFIGRNCFELFHSTDDEKIFRKVIETGEPGFTEQRPNFRNMSLIPAKDIFGKVVGLIHTSTEVTNRERAGQALPVRDRTEITEILLRLTRREIEICNMIKTGLASMEIARRLNLSIRSVENHRKNIRRKLDLTNKNINLGTFLSSI